MVGVVCLECPARRGTAASFLIIDDEGYLQLHGRTPFGWEPERYTDEHPDPFAEAPRFAGRAQMHARHGR